MNVLGEDFRACHHFAHLDRFAAVEWSPGDLLTDVAAASVAEIGAGLVDRGVPVSVKDGRPVRYLCREDLEAVFLDEIRTEDGFNLAEYERHIRESEGGEGFSFKVALSGGGGRRVRSPGPYGNSEGVPRSSRRETPCRDGGWRRHRMGDLCRRCLAVHVYSRWRGVVLDLQAQGQVLTYYPGRYGFEFQPHEFLEPDAVHPDGVRFVLLRDVAGLNRSGGSVQKKIANGVGRPREYPQVVDYALKLRREGEGNRMKAVRNAFDHELPGHTFVLEKGESPFDGVYRAVMDTENKGN